MSSHLLGIELGTTGSTADSVRPVLADNILFDRYRALPLISQAESEALADTFSS